ncbi:MAG: hypothetical protein M0P31_08440 [Solirubrobacteraceae bacterium]|nr:hypothetical protein [Solirubrobacteraceae bacterium]
MSTNEPQDAGRQPTQEELMAAYEEQMRNVRVEDVVVQALASLIELGGRRAGLAPGPDGRPDPADPEQLRIAIEAVKALQPVCEPLLGPNAKQVQQALSQLQVAYAQLAQGGGGPAADATGPLGADVSPGGAAEAPGAAGPAGQPPRQEPGPVESGRLWIPGQ